jgi:hypothetical protein
MENLTMNDCSELISLHVSAKNLPNLDITSKTDPYCILSIRDGKKGAKTRVGISEVKMDTLNPEWTSDFQVTYHFENIQMVTIDVYDKDSSSPLERTSAHTFIGSFEVKLSNIMCNSNCIQSGPLVGRRAGKAEVTVRGDAVANTRDVLICNFKGKKLSNKDGFFGRSDPFLVISKCMEDGTYVRVWENKPIMNNLNPSWPQTRVEIAKICNGDDNRPIKIDIFDYDSDGSHDKMGHVITNLRDLLNNGAKGMDVTEIKRGKEKKAGTLFCVGEIKRLPSFTEFINGGMQIDVAVAIDFTASNGNPCSKKSLHYMDPGGHLNEYQQALAAVGNVLDQYNTSGTYPVYGFGASVNGKTNHCFSIYDGEVKGVDGIQKAYNDCISNVKLSGPTVMAPFLNHVYNKHAPVCTAESQGYTIALIIADGSIVDMDDTIDAIISLSYRPVSIIIIGVGQADFDDMEALDGDEGVLTSKLSRRSASRDIVQFVAFNKFRRQGIEALAAEVLREIPTQVLSFMENNHINPLPPPPPYLG